MGVYTRVDSPWFWIYLDGYGIKERTAFRADATTAGQRKHNRQLAEQYYHARMTGEAQGGLRPDEKPAITFRDFAAWFETHLLPSRRGAERERVTLPRLVRDFGDLALDQITVGLVAEWMTTRLNTPTIVAAKKHTKARMVKAGPSTVNREVAILKAILQAAVPDYLPASPLYGMKLLHTTSPRRRVLTPEEETRLLRVLTPEDRALYLLGVDSLVRMGDILDVKRSDRDGDTVWIADPKTGGGYHAPLSKRTQKALDAIPDDGSGYYFSLRRRPDTAAKRRNGVKQMIQRACDVVDIPYGRANGLTFHWMTRRTGATRMLTNGVDLGTTQKLGRWATPDVLLGIYHEQLDEKARAAVEVPGRRSRSVPGRSEKRRKSKKSA